VKLVIEIGQIIHDFAIIMIVAAVMSLLSYKLRQPMVIGYIIAGMIIGPFAFNFIFKNVPKKRDFAKVFPPHYGTAATL
jgi:Kef-type K+ transport system membrane component KefB